MDYVASKNVFLAGKIPLVHFLSKYSAFAFICGWLEKIISEDIVKAGLRNFGNHFLHNNLKKSSNYLLLVSEIFVLTIAKNKEH